MSKGEGVFKKGKPNGKRGRNDEGGDEGYISTPKRHHGNDEPVDGLGNDPAVASLRKLLNREEVDVAVLVETKLSGEEMRRVVGRLGDFKGVSGDSIGRKAGVAIIWRSGAEVRLISSSAHHVDVEVRGLFSEDTWRLTGFYGWADNEEKDLSWQLLRDLRGLSTLPWLIIGDFNQILYDHEKKGGVPRAQGDMDKFRFTLDDCGLVDISYSGETFTWWNKRSEPNDIFERLDRGVASLDWLEKFPGLTLCHLERDRSDHRPLKLTRVTRGKMKRKKQYRFEDCWVSSDKCEGVIEEAWGGGVGEGNEEEVVAKIGACARALDEWSKKEFGDITRKLGEAKKRVAFLDSCRPSESVVTERREVSEQIDKLLGLEEIYWRQRSRVAFMKDGDRNTKFFHMKASTRKRQIE
ncbi:uncharacterized protein LOC141651854 [Silene latifolia]|uniref:uncharacterized protein LOC141651854 n=1 Tax=Silene latifolia TaxID=37657 RepID=UPI003D77DD9E